MRFVLHSPNIRKRAETAVRLAPPGWTVDIRGPLRSGEQNNAFWALMGELANTVPFAGERRSQEDWRTLILSGWLKATGRHVTVLPGLEGEPVALGMHSARLSKPEMSEVIEYAQAKVAQWKS